MAGPITQAAVALRARDRLLQIRNRLQAKIDTLHATDLEKQIHHLAGQAYEAMSRPEPTVAPPHRPYMPPQGDRASQFLFMGAVGPDIAGFAAPNTPLQTWLRDTLAKGSPDEHAERVLASSSDYLIKLWEELKARVPATDATNRGRMRAYMLGHCSHLATAVVIGPYLDALEARRTEGGWTRLSRREIASGIEDRMAQALLGRDASRAAPDLVTWWPDVAIVPEAFEQASKAALEAVYGSGARRPGSGVWEAAFAAHPPPELSEDLLRDAYRSFRMQFDRSARWSLTDWMVQLLPIFLPLLFALPLMAASNSALAIRQDPVPPGTDEDAGRFDTLGLPLAMASLSSLITMIVLQTSSFGAEGRTIFGWINAAVQFVVGVLTLITKDKSSPARWILLFALPLVAEIVFVIFALTKVSRRNPRSWQLALTGILHPLMGLVFALFFLAFLHKGAQALKDEEGGTFALHMLLWLLIDGALWMVTALIMRYLATPNLSPMPDLADRLPIALPAGVTSAAMTAPGNVLLFDDMILASAPPATGAPADAPAVALYPAGRRPLLKLWWEGAGPPTIRPRRDRIDFVFAGGTRTVFAPALPITVADLAALLQRVVTDPGGGGGSLHAVSPFAGHAAAEGGLLPPGFQFSDHGDLAATAEEHDRLVAEARPIGVDEASAYLLHAAPRGERSVRFGRTRVGSDQRLTDNAVLGSGTVASGAGPLAIQLTTAGAAGDLRSLFRPGDFVEIPFGQPPIAGAGAVRRQVASVDSATQLTLTGAFPAAIAGGVYGRVVPRAGQGTVSAAAGLRTLTVAGNATLPLTRLFRPGDWIEAPFGTDFAPRRVVVSVDSDTQLTVATPFPAALAAVAYGRIARSPTGGEVVPPAWRLRIDPQGADNMPEVHPVPPLAAAPPLTEIGALLAPGDVIRVTMVAPALGAPQVREVIGRLEITTTLGGSQVERVPLHLPIDFTLPPTPPPVAPPPYFATFQRIGGADPAELIRFEASRDDTVFTGDALINEATELAVLLNLGITSHLLEPAELLPAASGAATAINPTYQVFRNWNLDRRRINEWRMIIQGDALSEKGGAPDRRDPAMAPLPDTWRSTSPAGEPVATRMGWLPLFRRWLDMAGRPGQDASSAASFRPGDPSNADLSRAIAFLLDQTPPA